jgi:glycosyltransferase involved in cell wall biosynthesis
MNGSPRVSVILPTYNRATFLPEAFESIRSQTLNDWELIVVDDGSTDGTRQIVERLQLETDRPLRYVFQKNQGAYAARNTGLDHATGPYIAFFDSDDLWAPTYLERTVSALDRQPTLDWVYTACRRINLATATTIDESTYLVDGKPRPFLSLRTQNDRDLHVITDSSVLECQIRHGLYAGLQNSVIRARVFDGQRFWPDYRVVEDVYFLIRRLAAGITIGYLDDVYVTYRVHETNSSASGGNSTERLEEVFREQIRACARVLRETPLSTGARTALRRLLGEVYFWRLGYATLWPSDRRAEAMVAFRSGLRTWPWQLAMWKTYLLRTLARRLP